MVFDAGQRVVCIGDLSFWKISGSDYAAKCTFPVFGKVYTVRDYALFDGKPGILLDEIRNPIGEPDLGFSGEIGFATRCFRPLDDRRIDVFRAHLAPAPKQPVDA